MRGKITDNEARSLNLLLEKVYRDSGYDFRGYRCGMVTRRLQRRLHATGSKTYQEYMSFLDTCPEEYESLIEDLAIKISSFFRNGYAFQQLASLVLPEMVSVKRRQRSLRFWSTACTRGEEPYSIAIMLHQFLGDRIGDFDISIYASDISRCALRTAQSGQYPAENVAALPSTVLNRYFRRRGSHYTISDELKRMVKFHHFNLVSGETPPFTDLDCIFCCNILIYLQRQLQERVLDMLYKSLATPGYLVLGEVETPTDGLHHELECLDTKAKIYRKNGRRNYASKRKD
jgi:chemotaxis methyl-accepting protein methylase